MTERWRPASGRGRARLALGLEGESNAEKFLSGLGYRLLERSCRNRLGQIDLVMKDGETVVFVEVKTRSSTRYGFPEESVTADKQRRIARTALAYVKEKRLENVPLRFDVVSILGSEIRHIRDAFQVSGYTL